MFAEYETGEQPALNPNWRREEAGLEIHMLGSRAFPRNGTSRNLIWYHSVVRECNRLHAALEFWPLLDLDGMRTSRARV
jgi:hypothetical protein